MEHPRVVISTRERLILLASGFALLKVLIHQVTSAIVIAVLIKVVDLFKVAVLIVLERQCHRIAIRKEH